MLVYIITKQVDVKLFMSIILIILNINTTHSQLQLKAKLGRLQEELLPTWGLSSSSSSLFSLTAAPLLLFSSVGRRWLLLITRLRRHAFFCSIKSLLKLFGGHLPYETYGYVQLTLKANKLNASFSNSACFRNQR